LNLNTEMQTADLTYRQLASVTQSNSLPDFSSFYPRGSNSDTSKCEGFSGVLYFKWSFSLWNHFQAKANVVVPQDKLLQRQFFLPYSDCDMSSKGDMLNPDLLYQPKQL
jgi:hypothetical protein